MKNKFYASLFLVGSLLFTSKAYSGSAFVGGSINIQNDGYKMTTNKAASNSSSMVIGKPFYDKASGRKCFNLSENGKTNKFCPNFKKSSEDMKKELEASKAFSHSSNFSIKTTSKTVNGKKLSSHHIKAEYFENGKKESFEFTINEEDFIENSETNSAENSNSTSVSKVSPSISLLAGYATKINNFGFISEAGVDLSLSTVGKKSKEVTMKSKFHVYLAQKAGYYFNENNLTYVTAGLSVREYIFTIAEKEENAGSFNIILGIGFERAINEKLKLFTEFNNIASLGDIKIGANKFKTSSQQFKVGFRYHINYL